MFIGCLDFCDFSILPFIIIYFQKENVQYDLRMHSQGEAHKTVLSPKWTLSNTDIYPSGCRQIEIEYVRFQKLYVWFTSEYITNKINCKHLLIKIIL